MAPGEEMQMEVGDCFTSMSPIINDDTESIFRVPFLTGDISHPEQEMT